MRNPWELQWIWNWTVQHIKLCDEAIHMAIWWFQDEKITSLRSLPKVDFGYHLFTVYLKTRALNKLVLVLF